ncbi:hypothetical protein [Castellaniella caeni]
MSTPTLNVSFLSDDWRGVALSNFCLCPFVLDDVLLASVEGFIQGIKFAPGHPARERAFISSAWDAKACGKGPASSTSTGARSPSPLARARTTIWSSAPCVPVSPSTRASARC